MSFTVADFTIGTGIDTSIGTDMSIDINITISKAFT